MNWNRLKFIQKTPEQHIWKARNQGAPENSHIGQRTRTAGSADVKVRGLEL